MREKIVKQWPGGALLSQKKIGLGWRFFMRVVRVGHDTRAECTVGAQEVPNKITNTIG